VDAWRFQEVLSRLQLLSTPLQVEAAAQDFASLGAHGRGRVCYDDFCAVLEAEARAGMGLGQGQGAGGGYGYGYGSGRGLGGGGGRGDSGYHGSGEDGSGALSAGNVDRWYSREASPKQRRDFGELYESLRAFKNVHGDGAGSGGFGRGSISLDPGSEGPDRDRGLYPPKVSDSWSFSRSLPRPPPGSAAAASRYGAASGSREGLRDSWDRDRDRGFGSGSGRASPVPPRSPPSKVGSKMWGSSTSLEEKGRPPRLEDGLWCCVVCLYTENAAGAAKCAICDSANHLRRKDFVVKEQCRNCTFQNGALSSHCEMCGSRLAMA